MRKSFSGKRRTAVMTAGFLLWLFTVPSWGGGLEYYNKGREAEKAGNRLEALRNYALAIEAGDLSIDRKAYIFYRKGSIRGYLGESALGISEFSKSIEFNPTHGNAYSLRGYLLGVLGEYSLAEKDHIAAVDLARYSKWDDYLPWVFQHYADLWRRKGNYQMALEYCDRAMAKKAYAVANFRRAWIYLNMGQYPLASQEFAIFKKEMDRQGVTFDVFWPDERQAIERLETIAR